MNSYQLGLVVGFFVALVGLVIFAKKQGVIKEMKGELDERQKSAQNLSYKYAYFSLLVLLCIYAFLDKTIGLPYFDTFAGVFTCMMISILVFAVTAIVKDAYFGFQQRKKSFYTFGLVLTAIELVGAVRFIVEGEFLKDGVLSTGYIYVLVAVLWIILILTSVLHDWRNKETEE